METGYVATIVCTMDTIVVVLPVPGGPSTRYMPLKPGRERAVTTSS